MCVFVGWFVSQFVSFNLVRMKEKECDVPRAPERVAGAKAVANDANKDDEMMIFMVWIG